MPKIVDENKIQEGLKLLNVPTPVRPTVRSAAMIAGVSHSTLHDRYTGKHGPRGGKRSNTLLTLQQEKALVRFITFYDDWAQPPTYSQILERALELARQSDSTGTITKIGKCWIRRFIKRHPIVRGRLSRQLDRDRAKADNIHVLRDFFQKYRSIIERFGIRPQDIYNFDEKGVMYGQTGREWVITRKARKIAYVQQDGGRKSITIIECARAGVPNDMNESEENASASIPLDAEAQPHILPPVFLTAGTSYNEANFKYLTKTVDGKASILPGARFRKSENGYNEKAICFWYIKDHFDPLTASFDKNGNLRHRLLIMDGHGSHLTTEIIRYCMERNIHILCLPGHSTHRLQPLDVGVFGPLDKAYKKQVSEWTRNETDGGKINLAAFFLCYHRAREIAITNRNVRSAFRTCGLDPINPRHVIAKVKQEVGDEVLEVATRKFDFLKPDTSDPFSLPKTPSNMTTLRQIALAADQLVSVALGKKPDPGTYGEYGPDDFIKQLHKLLRTSLKAAQRAISDRDLLSFQLNKLRKENKPDSLPNPRQRKLGEELTTEGVLAEREEKARRDHEEELAKQERARVKEANRILNAERNEQKRLRKEAKEKVKAPESACIQGEQSVASASGPQMFTQYEGGGVGSSLPIPVTPTVDLSQSQHILATPTSILYSGGFESTEPCLPFPSLPLLRFPARVPSTPTPAAAPRARTRNQSKRLTKSLSVSFDGAEIRSYNPEDAPDGITDLLSSLSLSKPSKSTARNIQKIPPTKRQPPKAKSAPKPTAGKGSVARGRSARPSAKGTRRKKDVSMESESRTGGGSGNSTLAPVIAELRKTRVGRVIKPSMWAKR